MSLSIDSTDPILDLLPVLIITLLLGCTGVYMFITTQRSISINQKGIRFSGIKENGKRHSYYNWPEITNVFIGPIVLNGVPVSDKQFLWVITNDNRTGRYPIPGSPRKRSELLNTLNYYRNVNVISSPAPVPPSTAPQTTLAPTWSSAPKVTPEVPVAPPPTPEVSTTPVAATVVAPTVEMVATESGATAAGYPDFENPTVTYDASQEPMGYDFSSYESYSFEKGPSRLYDFIMAYLPWVIGAIPVFLIQIAFDDEFGNEFMPMWIGIPVILIGYFIGVAMLMGIDKLIDMMRITPGITIDSNGIETYTRKGKKKVTSNKYNWTDIRNFDVKGYESDHFSTILSLHMTNGATEEVNLTPYNCNKDELTGALKYYSTHS